MDTLAAPFDPWHPTLMPRHTVTLHPHLVHRLVCPATTPEQVRSTLAQLAEWSTSGDSEGRIIDCTDTCACPDAPRPGHAATLGASA